MKFLYFWCFETWHVHPL